jgi:predicted GNAT superfamily acetyltransferase
VEISIRIITNPQDMIEVEDLQQLVWPGDAREVVPSHLMTAVIKNGGLLIGAYFEGLNTKLVGFVFGFPGYVETPTGQCLVHCSHNLGIHPEFRDQGVGYRLKRAQWQMIRRQGIERISWTYDPLLSRNARLNINKLGAVCDTYIINYYGELRDEMNRGLSTDRFQVDWWVNTTRVYQHLNEKTRRDLDLAHYIGAGAQISNPTQVDKEGFVHPGEIDMNISKQDTTTASMVSEVNHQQPAFHLVEIPANFLVLKSKNPLLAEEWRMHSRQIFQLFFSSGYIVTDFIYLSAKMPRSFYVLTNGDRTL